MRDKRLLCVLVPMLALCGPGSAGAQPTRPTTAPRRFIALRFINSKTKQPLAGVSMTVQLSGRDFRDRVKYGAKTDAQGRSKIKLPTRPMTVYRIYPRKDGFVPLRVYWGGGQAPPEFPEEFTVAMDPATPVGGVVKDEQGLPIEGVVVAFRLLGRSEGPIRVNIDYQVKTDKDGRWRCNIAPADLVPDLRIFLKHRDYISDHWTSGMIPMPKYPRPSQQALQSLTAEYVMKRGVVLAGVVVDGEGKPVGGARIKRGESGREQRPMIADAEGRFRITDAPPREVLLTVLKKGFAPQLLRVTASKGMQPLRIQLEKGHTIRGRVIDKQGRSVADAAAGVEDWRQVRTLEWGAKTDAEGRFTWTDAPADTVRLYVYKQGYMSVREYSARPSAEERLITLLPPVRIHGSVVDAATGKPLEKFRALPGIDWGRGSSPYWESRNAKPFTDGRYELSFTYPRAGHLVRIEADGYKPAISRSIADDEGNVTVDFKLERGVGLAGVVRLPDGKPAAGAQVVLATPSQGAYIRNGSRISDQGCPTVKTSADGRYAFGVQEGKWALVVIHEAGYAELSDDAYQKSPDIQLKPWGRIEGRLMIGSRPGADERITMWLSGSRYDPTQPRIYHDIRSETDKGGRFTIKRAPPGEWGVSRSVRTGENTWSYQQGEKVTVEAGQTVKVALGGKGRPVTGQVVLPPGAKGIDLGANRGNIGTKIELPKPPIPGNWDSLDRQGRREWYEKWSKSEEGKEYLKAQQEYSRTRKHYNVPIRPDGSFRVEDVVAGRYELSIYIRKSQTDPRAGLAASLTHEFIIPEIPGGQSDKPLDLGKLTLKMDIGVPAQRAVTPAAPATEARKLLSRPLPKLEGLGLKPASQLAPNKRILVCFWDMAQRPSRHCVTTLGKTADQLAGKGVAVILVHAAAGGPPKVKQWLTARTIAAPCGRVTADKEKEVLAGWGVVRLPWLILTDEKHVVQAEGFALSDLNHELKKTSK